MYKKLSGCIIESAPYSETVMLYMPFFLYVTPTSCRFTINPDILILTWKWRFFSPPPPLLLVISSLNNSNMTRSVELPIRTILKLLIRDIHVKFGSPNSHQCPYIEPSSNICLLNFQKPIINSDHYLNLRRKIRWH